ncbi:hypothetical protein NLU13_8226 [Sarocladium strictum]|uniref:Uncharacterized protein n=1 Tax=Sarocladium strictum TaxID=5046 RepID=A0AA39L4S5_SARSR|nr:hypothetical protein NLU13_8226 [Sarocladium strictum]
MGPAASDSLHILGIRQRPSSNLKLLPAHLPQKRRKGMSRDPEPPRSYATNPVLASESDAVLPSVQHGTKELVSFLNFVEEGDSSFFELYQGTYALGGKSLHESRHLENLPGERNDRDGLFDIGTATIAQ